MILYPYIFFPDQVGAWTLAIDLARVTNFRVLGVRANTTSSVHQWPPVGLVRDNVIEPPPLCNELCFLLNNESFISDSRSCTKEVARFAATKFYMLPVWRDALTSSLKWLNPVIISLDVQSSVQPIHTKALFYIILARFCFQFI